MSKINMNLIFDIGSNAGRTAEIFITKAEKVVCFEPNPYLADYLNKKFEENNVVIDRRGVSDSITTKIFNISDLDLLSTFSEDWINHSRFANQHFWHNHIEVQTVTLDNIIKEYGIPDYIKIDVEGHEFEVLTSFTTVLENTLVCFEWAEEQKQKIISILNHLRQIGYEKFFYTEADDVIFEDSVKWSNLENLGLIENLDENRKIRWGMIYFKK